MCEQVREFQSDIERLESRLACAKADLARIRERMQKSRGATPFALAIVALVIVLGAATPPGKTVTAPFQVFDPVSKHKMFEVSENTSDHPRGFALYDASERPQAFGIATDGLSEFRASSPEGGYAAMGVLNEGGQSAGLVLKYGGQPHVYLSVHDNGEAAMTMRNDRNVGIVLAGKGDSGGGLLLLNDAQGKPVVKFSTSANGAGTVVTYPNNGAGGAIVGLKGTMLCGRGGCGK